MSAPWLLDLFCGAGGAAVGYHRAGFKVIGVDIRPQPNYPFNKYVADALTFPLDGVDVIHASPPCQHWTAYKRRPDHVAEYPDLVAAVRDRLIASGKPYIIENIRGAPLRHAVMLCGSSFGLDVRRHRFFESNIALFTPQCEHDRQSPRFAQATNRVNKRCTVEVGVWRIPLEVQQRAMGIDWMTLEELSEAVPPAYTEWLGRQLIEAVRGRESCDLLSPDERTLLEQMRPWLREDITIFRPSDIAYLFSLIDKLSYVSRPKELLRNDTEAIGQLPSAAVNSL